MREKKEAKWEMLVGLQVVDEASYQIYREAMSPILSRHGGGFGYDFAIREVLKSETGNPMNRVFTIRFEDQDSMDAFFANREYLAIKNAHFEKAVAHTTIIAKYRRENAEEEK